MEELKQDIIKSVKFYIETWNSFARYTLDGMEYILDPEIVFDVKGKTAGYAVGFSKLRFNLELAAANREDFLKNTVGHEVAHLIDMKVMSGRGHGKSWKSIMRTLNLEPTRCHNYDVTQTYTETFVYGCGCVDHYFSKRRHNNVVLRGIRYRCKYCGLILEHKS